MKLFTILDFGHTHEMSRLDDAVLRRQRDFFRWWAADTPNYAPAQPHTAGRFRSAEAYRCATIALRQCRPRGPRFGESMPPSFAERTLTDQACLLKPDTVKRGFLGNGGHGFPPGQCPREERVPDGIGCHHAMSFRAEEISAEREADGAVRDDRAFVA